MTKKTKNSIPFSFNPKGWFLKGKEKERAKAQHELSGVELDKKLADIDDKPFVTVLNTNFDPDNPKKGYFELDWNQAFIDMLSKAGYSGVSDDEIVNKWFDDLCKGIVLETMDTDVFEELKAQQDSKNQVSKTKLEDGKVEYS
tara:strand:+ start:324 stop:752 length:429 start_codon:yes stop_codon:yes gene_type:complete